MHTLRTAFFVLVLTATVAAVRAQSVHWEKGDSSLGNTLQLVFEDCEPDGNPQLPSIPNATLTFTGRSESVNMVNFNVSRTVTLNFVVQSRGGALQIPAFTVKTTKGSLNVAAFNGTTSASETIASSKLIPDRTKVWAGEVLGLTYELAAARRGNPTINQTFDWNPAPLLVEEWSKPEVTERNDNGERNIVVTYHTRGVAKTADNVTLNAATQLVNVQTGSTMFGLFAQPRMEPLSVTSDQPTIEVRPLPTAPAGFGGAVGQFRLTSKVVPQTAAVGEPVTWTLDLSGTGNWPDVAGLPSREVSKDFQVVQPKAKRVPAEGKLFDATLTEDVVLVPTKPGSYTLDPVTFVYFDPRLGRYQTSRTSPATITITPPSPPAFGSPAAGAAAAGSAEARPAAESAKPITTPSPPLGIPHDPLPGQGNAALPLSNRELVLWLLVPIAALVPLWFGLAWVRARKTDPLRPQREAHHRLAAVLSDFRSPSRDDAAIRESLQQWQREAANLWQVSRAAPAPTDLGHVEWVSLWREADQTLYGRNAPLPSDWVPRAEAALAAKRLPRFHAARLFLPQNLLPFAAAIALVLMLAPLGMRATAEISPDASYRAGDFAGAEKTWRETVAQRPTDWIARHNLSLALAQQDDFGEAAAEATAALVQHPDDPAVRWHFDYVAEKAGFAPGPLLPFVKDSPPAAIALLASPADWQRILIFAAFVAAAALGWVLVNAYRGRSRWQFWAAAGVVVVSGALGFVAIFGYETYDNAADINAIVTWRAGILRSIPTEADTAQKTTTLAPGTLAVVNKTFLGWDRLQFPNGQTGWVRHEEVVPLWR